MVLVGRASAAVRAQASYVLHVRVVASETYRGRNAIEFLGVAEAEAQIAGRLGHLPGGHGTDLTIEARGPDASVIVGIGAISLPAARPPLAASSL